MYALIYDEHHLDRPQKKVLSIHENREDAELALEKRKEKLGKKYGSVMRALFGPRRKSDPEILSGSVNMTPGGLVKSAAIPPGNQSFGVLRPQDNELKQLSNRKLII
jgi:hypothetical protein